MDAIKALAAHFPIGAVQSCEAVEVGLIHKTYRIETAHNTFCLQGLHPKLSTDEILSDYQHVTAFLADAHFPAPQLVLTEEGSPAWEDLDGVRWRMTTWLPGRTFSSIHSDQMVFSAASMLGRFHKQMSSFEAPFLSKHPLHQTRHHLQCLKDAVARSEEAELLEQIRPMIEEVERELPPLFLPELPQRVVHGDPKISNIMFDEQLNAVGIIDLDTCCRHSVLVDLGDAVRSWCRDGGEDEQRDFSLTRFASLMRGYVENGPSLEREELALLPDAGRMITLELTSRFLADVLEDCYFGWDKKRYSSRREHNLARSHGMLHLAQQMQAHQGEITSIVEQTFTPADSIFP